MPSPSPSSSSGRPDANADSPSATPALRRRERLIEPAISETTAEQFAVEADTRLVRRVVLAGSVSKNGYTYRAEALRDAASLYENKPVFLDHAADPSQPRRRSARDLVGTIANVRYESSADGDRLRGDVRVLDTESGRTFLALCQAEGTGVGMSHVVLARRSADGKQVESIEQVVSVDAVAFPATTTSFREQTDDDPADSDADDMTPRHDDGDSVSQIAIERDLLRDRVGELQQQLARRQRGSRRDRMLAESGLPDAVISETFRNAVRAAKTDQTAATLIEDRRWLVQSVAAPFSESRRGDRPADEAAAFVAAIRRS